jgi:hypothetical protein
LSRETDIRALTQPLLDELYELHDRSKSGEPRATKDDRLSDAYRAIQIWWQLFGTLMIWAQERILGHEIMQASPERMAALAELGFDEKSDFVEFFGINQATIHPDQRPPPASEISFSDEALRNGIVRLLACSEENSSLWREPLSHALRAANAGEVHPLFDPGKKRRRGRPYVLDITRAVAVAHVYYLVGKGFKKHVALDRVSKAIGANTETIRSWEKSLAADRAFKNLWRGAQLAGDLEMKGHVVFTEEDAEPLKNDFEPESIPDYFIRFIERLHNDWSLEVVQENLRRFHTD